jgi:hypothetical protein
MPQPRTFIPRKMAHKLLMILLIIYFRNYVDNLIYMRGMLMRIWSLCQLSRFPEAPSIHDVMFYFSI